MTAPQKRTRRQIANRRSEAQKKKAKVFLRDGEKCRYCGATDALTLDHLTPLSRGGSNGYANLGLACHDCNNDKDNMTELEYMAELKRRAAPKPPVEVVYKRRKRAA